MKTTGSEMNPVVGEAGVDISEELHESFTSEEIEAMY